MKEQWLKGIQWGSIAWLTWDAFATVNTNVHTIAQVHGRESHHVACAVYAVASIVAVVALALAWTRWSRLGAGVLIATEIVTVLIFYRGYPRPQLMIAGVPYVIELPWSIWVASLSRSLPLLPLVFMAPERPRVAVAMALLGRWRDAFCQLAGWRWIAVAGAVFCVGDAMNAAFASSFEEARGLAGFLPLSFIAELGPCALLLGVSAFPLWRTSTTA